jgi:hypothetical protein
MRPMVGRTSLFGLGPAPTTGQRTSPQNLSDLRAMRDGPRPSALFTHIGRLSTTCEPLEL